MLHYASHHDELSKSGMAHVDLEELKKEQKAEDAALASILCIMHHAYRKKRRNNGGYGPWPHFTAQLARHFLITDDRDMAEKYLGWCVEIAHNHDLPEHISTLMNFLVWEENYKRVGILRDDKVRLIEQIKKHEKWEEGLIFCGSFIMAPC